MDQNRVNKFIDNIQPIDIINKDIIERIPFGIYYIGIVIVDILYASNIISLSKTAIEGLNILFALSLCICYIFSRAVADSNIIIDHNEYQKINCIKRYTVINMFNCELIPSKDIHKEKLNDKEGKIHDKIHGYKQLTTQYYKETLIFKNYYKIKVIIYENENKLCETIIRFILWIIYFTGIIPYIFIINPEKYRYLKKSNEELDPINFA